MTCLCLAVTNTSLKAQSYGATTFTSQTAGTITSLSASPVTGTCAGWNATLVNTSSGSIIVNANNGLIFQCNSGLLTEDRIGVTSLTSFKFNYLTFRIFQGSQPLNTRDLTFTGYRSGAPVTGATITIANYSGTSTGPPYTFTTASAGANAAFNNVDEIRFTYSGTAVLASLCIEKIDISAAVTLTTGATSGTAFCSGAQLTVPYSSTNTWNTGNIFTAQLSNSLGSFASPVDIGTLSGTTASGTIDATIPANTASGSGYRIRVVASNPAATATDNGTNITVTNTASDANTQYLANATASSAVTLSSNIKQHYTDGSCRGIASIIPTGAALGSTTSKVYLQSSAPAYNGQRYVRRYYDINPSTNATTGTATVTLYFTQADFTDYNNNNGSATDLPSGPNDAAGKAALRVTQQHGTSATGAPGSFTGWSGGTSANVLITPGANNVFYNSNESRWEVTFPVTGFSGFFVSGGNAVPLPVKLAGFSASAAGANNRIMWQTGTEDAGTSFIITRSSNGSSFEPIGKAIGKGPNSPYMFIDEQPLAGTSYYRLRIEDVGGNISLSGIAVVRGPGNKGSITISPQPAHNTLTIINSNSSLSGIGAIIYNVQGAAMTSVTISDRQDIDISGWLPGLYWLKLQDGEVVKVVKD